MQPAGRVEPSAQPRPQAPQPEADHGEADADHDAERPEDDRYRRLFVTRHALQPFEGGVRIMLQDQRADLGDGELVARRLRVLIGHAEQDQRGAVGVILEMPFHRQHLGRLMLERVDAVHVPRDELDRRHQRRHPHGHRESGAHLRRVVPFEEVPRRHPADHERGGEIGGDDGVDEAIGKARVPDDVPPRPRLHELADVVDGEGDRGLHPAVDAEDPEGGDEGADGDHQRRDEVEFLAHPLEPEQHHAEEARFEEEGGQHLIGHQRADDRPRLVGEHRPVGAELVGHDDAADDAHRKGDRENAQPVAEQVEIFLLAGHQPARFEHREKARQPDREGGEDEVKADRERELRAGQ